MGGTAAVLLALLSAAPVAAATPVEQLIVTGTRLAAEEAKLPAASTVLGADEIAARGDSSVIDLLRGVPGIQAVQPGAGGVPQVFIRGSEPNYTVFMIDGIKVNDPNNTRGGSFDLASLNLADVERIEIVRGPQSSIYGSDALAGVINVISPAGGGPLAASVEAEAGADEFARGSLALSGPAGAGGFSLQLTSRDDGEAVPGSTYEANTAVGRLRLAPAAAGIEANLYARFADTEGTSFPDQSGGPELATLRTLDRASARDLGIGGDFDWRVSDVFSVQGLVSRYERRDRYDSPGIAPGDAVPPNGARNELDRDNASLRLTAMGSGGWSATAGIDWQREQGESAGYLELGPGFRLPNTFALERDIVGIFAEGRSELGERLLIQASVRHDEPDGVSGETTGRIGAVFSSPDGRTRLRANWGTGFKLPSFFALGSPLVGDPDLLPEESRSLDVGLSRRLGAAAELSVTLFHNEYENFIDFDDETVSSVNRDEVTTRGFELAGTWMLSPALDLRGHATWTDIDIDDDALNDRKLLQRPDWRGGIALRWAPRASWLVEVDWLYVGEAFDSAIPTGRLTLDAYHRVDLNLAWRATPRLRLALALDNLLDAEYEEAIGFPAPGIRPRLSARYRFGG